MKTKFKPEEYIEDSINSKEAFILPFRIKSIKVGNKKILFKDAEFKLGNKNIICGLDPIKDLFINQINQAFKNNLEPGYKVQIKFTKPKEQINCSSENKNKCLFIYHNFNKIYKKKTLSTMFNYLKEIPLQVVIVSRVCVFDGKIDKIIRNNYKEHILHGKLLRNRDIILHGKSVKK